ncbi:helix-turn-helix transcriptional regulator [Serratia fonticola]|uniref:helix-turn-helix transcriptional regulator n=1 Tax=Serratia fonticola TaxID=47917 RepID=UPI00157541B4|nr:helix-turn-helix transcriptional regulator [Serratia fonticola]NTY87922.1 helix-turn-helix transcriptional regulator [Serratia fonticola]NTZ13592.1 helix-turn-helix transcriptional regulator [Serratia fonticola]
MKLTKNTNLIAQALEDPIIFHDEKKPTKEVRLEDILREMRTEAGLSQADLAKKLLVTPPAVSRLEKRPYRASLDTLLRYAKACGFDLYFYYK